MNTTDAVEAAVPALTFYGSTVTRNSAPSRSFDHDSRNVVELDDGRVAHRAHIAQSERLARTMHEAAPGVWSLVGNGLSNQNFVEAPEGIIAIDTGESIEEMSEALDELAQVTDRPVAAVLYTHFHYVAGTAAVVERFGDVPVYGHAGIDGNRSRTASSISPAYGRGLVEQFGMMLPTDGPDGLVNVGLGHFFRNPDHAPFTGGHVSPTVTFEEPVTLQIAGLDVEVTPAPSDADDSVTFWFPDLGVAANNLVWPALFNVFAIRGEEYRDPRVLLAGLDHLASLEAAHLLGAHGPPFSGVAEIRERVTRVRDAIQLLWDQTVRHTNRGATSAEIAHLVQLPAACDDDPLTSEYYGVAEHHVRQIRSGLFGFFDGDVAQLFPLEPSDRAQRLVAGFGGAEVVRAEALQAIDADDLRWAVELGSWLVCVPEASDDDRQLLARALRLIAQRTSAANIRNWCLTRARDLDGTSPMHRYRTHRFPRRAVVADPVASVHALSVLADPQRLAGVDLRIAWHFGSDRAAMHVRNCVAVPLDTADTVDATLQIAPERWAEVMGRTTELATVIAAGEATIDGDVDAVVAALGGFDIGPTE